MIEIKNEQQPDSQAYNDLPETDKLLRTILEMILLLQRSSQNKN